MIRTSAIVILTALGVIASGCIAPREDRSWADLPVTHDPRPMYVLFSWAHEREFQFALVRERPTNRGEIGVARNDFLDRFDSRHTAGLDLASLEEKLKGLPTSSLVDWFIDDARHLSLPPSSVVQQIKRLISRRKATLNLDNIKDWMASTHSMSSPA